MVTQEGMEERVVVRLSKGLKEKVQEKADREAINLSQLIRNWLAEWVTPLEERESNKNEA